MSILYFPSDTNHSSKSSRELWPTKCLDIPSNWVWVFGQIQLILNGRNWAISWRKVGIFSFESFEGKRWKIMSGDSQGQNHSLDKSHRHIHFRFSLRIEIKWAAGLHLSGIYKSVWIHSTSGDYVDLFSIISDIYPSSKPFHSPWKETDNNCRTCIILLE